MEGRIIDISFFIKERVWDRLQNGDTITIPWHEIVIADVQLNLRGMIVVIDGDQKEVSIRIEDEELLLLQEEAKMFYDNFVIK